MLNNKNRILNNNNNHFFSVSKLNDGSDNDTDEEMEDEDSAKDQKKSDDDFAKAVKKATNMADSIKKKSGKRKLEGEEGNEEDDIVDKYGLDDYDEDDESRRFLVIRL